MERSEDCASVHSTGNLVREQRRKGADVNLMATECWVALCPHCHIVWCVDSREDPRLDEHPSEPTPIAVYQDYRKRWDEASNGILGALDVLDAPGHPEHDAARTWIDRANVARQKLLDEQRARTVWCVGSGQFLRCSTPEVMAYHEARRAEARSCPPCSRR